MFMVLANEVVARHMRQAGLGIPYRHHGPPDRDRLLHLLTLLKAKGMAVPAFPNAREGNDGQLLNALLSQITLLPQVEADTWQTALLKCLKLAEYDAQQPDHFGLASSCYCHFTSPIRRYADLLLHQRLGALLDDPQLGPEHFDDEELPLICEAISRSERASSRAERNFVEMKLLRHLQGRLGETLPGVISDVQPFGLFVRLEELWVDGLLREDRLDGQSYQFNRDLMCWVGRKNGRVFRLGDRLQVHLDRVDLLRRELELSLPNPASSSFPGAAWRGQDVPTDKNRPTVAREQGGTPKGGTPKGGTQKRSAPMRAPAKGGSARGKISDLGSGRKAKGRPPQRRKKR
jgi:ribonuclease R